MNNDNILAEILRVREVYLLSKPRPVRCRIFGCGKELTLCEQRYGGVCSKHCAMISGIRKEKIREAIQTRVEHRMEFVAMVRGVEFINDSKATNVNSTWFALENMDKPTIIIMGGVERGNDYRIIEALVKEKVKTIICLGVDNRKIHQAFSHKVSPIVNTGSATEAVHAAFYFASKGDAVLLSPACASFDLFINYEHRGEKFKRAVLDL